MRQRVNLLSKYWVLLLLLFGLCLTFFPALSVKAATHITQQVLSKNQFTANSDEMLARARKWTSIGVGYIQGKPYYPDNQTGYRPDCSGFVTMAWGLSNQPNGGLNTDGLAKVSHRISKEELRPGDILLNTIADAHVVIFGGWVSNGKLTTTVSDQYDALEENGSSFYGYALEHTIPFPYYSGYYPEDYVPMRLNAASNPIPPTTPSLVLKARPTSINGISAGNSNCTFTATSSDCLIVLSSPNSNQQNINWSATLSGPRSSGGGVHITPLAGTLAPGQQVDVHLLLSDICGGPITTETITFTGGTDPVVVQWSC